MDLASLQREIACLPEEMQDRLAAYLTALRLHRAGTTSQVHARLDDRTAENWQSWSSVKVKLGIENPGMDK